jgi:hypothetical protein
VICDYCGGNNRHLTWCGDYRPAHTQAAIVEVLRCHGPLTDEQLCQRIADQRTEPVSVSGIRTRRSELAAAGRVVDTGRRQPTRTGRSAIVWGLA